MEFICKKEYALTIEERALVGDMIFGGNYTQKQKDVLMGIARRWPERWYRGHKQYYMTIHQIANCPLFHEGSVDAVNYFSLTANWAKAYPHVVLALSEAIDTAPAPIDWAKEFDHMVSLRQKAIQYITEAVATCITIYLGEDGVASFDPDHGGWGGQEGVLATVMYNRYKQVILCDRYEESGDTDYEYTLDSLETSQLIEVAARVSQAIAGK